MADQFAVLGITVNADGAIKNVNGLRRELGFLSDAANKATSAVGANGMSPSLRLVNTNASGAHASLGRLRQSLESVTAEAVGANPVLSKLTGVLGEMALGSTVVTGVLLGAAAIATAYDKMTESSRQAMQQSDKLIESYLRAARVRALGVGGEQRADLQDIAKGTAAHASRAGFFLAAQSMFPVLGRFGKGDLSQVNAAGVASQEIVNQLGLAIAAANEKLAPSVVGRIGPTGRVTTPEDTQSAYMRYQALMRSTYGNLGNGPAAYGLSPMAAGERMHAAYYGALSDINGRIPNSFVMPSMDMGPVVAQQQSDREKHEREQLIKLGILHEDNSALKMAVQATAGAIGQIIASALNVGGGGLGSQIGGALGAGIGGGLGTRIGGGIGSIGGSILGPIGAVAGSVIGSALGGLFDHHKKSVDRNTQALDNLTAALYNAPSGYKVAGARYRADDGRYVYAAAANEAAYRHRRGGLGSMGLAA